MGIRNSEAKNVMTVLCLLIYNLKMSNALLQCVDVLHSMTEFIAPF